MRLTHTALREGKLLGFLRGELQLSSSLVKRLKWNNAFLVNGSAVHTDHRVLPGDVISVIMEEAVPDFPPQNDPIDILYEDDALLVIDKPPGLLMHPSFYRNEGTLANRVQGYYLQTGQACAFHPVSRLDRDTFGVVVIAKNAHIHAKMMEVLKAKQFQKTYEALVYGCPPEQGLWEFPIARKEGESLLREVRPDGQSAVTRYRLLETTDAVSKLALQPITGRTHQLRVHCAYAGFPILGDRQYGTQTSLSVREYPHQQLCAVRVEFPHPMTEETMTISCKQGVFL